MRQSRRRGETPRYTIPRRKDDSLCFKMNPAGGIAKAYLKIDCPGQWHGREAVSFNSDGFIQLLRLARRPEQPADLPRLARMVLQLYDT